MAVVPNVGVLVVPSVPMPEACVLLTPLEPELIMPVEVPVVGVLVLVLPIPGLADGMVPCAPEMPGALAMPCVPENSGALVIPEETELTGEVLEAPEVSVLVLVLVLGLVMVPLLVVLITDPL